jgi:purine-binding chemotaxis protein CheW
MSQQIVTSTAGALTVAGSRALTATESHDYVSITIGGQLFGIPVLQVQDVLGPQRITRIPLAPPEVAGSLNLRGRIVTAIDLRTRLHLPKRSDGGESMSVVVDQDGEPYSLLVDGVGEVLSLSGVTYERNPATLDANWRDVSVGVHRLDGKLLIILDIKRLLDFAVKVDAA